MSLAELEISGTAGDNFADSTVIGLDNVDKEFLLGGAFLNQAHLKAL